MLFGLFASLLGVGYAFAKDKQKFNNMNANAVRMYGRGINESIDDMAITNKYFWEIKDYYDERYDYYKNNQNIVKTNDYYKTYPLQQCIICMSYDDMFKKYAPDFLRWTSNPHTDSRFDFLTKDSFCFSTQRAYCHLSFGYISRALARKEVYKMGFLPAHMNVMGGKFEGQNLYYLNGSGYGAGCCEKFPSDYDKIDWWSQEDKYGKQFYFG